MKIVIRDRRTGMYLKNGSSFWADHVQDAFDFETSSAASRWAVLHKLREVEVIVKFRNDRFDIRIPL
jgi:hypothetical protein